jgi:predicted ester cyclase
MKKLLVILSAVCICLFTSCSGKKEGGMSATAKKNQEAMRGVTKCFDTKDFSKLGDYIAEDGIEHAGEKGDIKGLANMKAEFEKMVAGYENSTTEVIKELADDDYVMTWQRYKGTLKTDQMGMKAGDKFDMSALEVAKFKDGKAVEHWTFMQPSDMMKMMPPPPPPAMDTTKHN